MATDFLSSVIEAYNTGARFNPEVMRQEALGNQFKLELQRLAVEEALQNQQDRLNPQAANTRKLLATLTGQTADPLSGTRALSPEEQVAIREQGNFPSPGAITQTQQAALLNQAPVIDEMGFPSLQQPVIPRAAMGTPVTEILGPGGVPTGFSEDFNSIIARNEALTRAKGTSSLDRLMLSNAEREADRLSREEIARQGNLTKKDIAATKGTTGIKGLTANAEQTLLGKAAFEGINLDDPVWKDENGRWKITDINIEARRKERSREDAEKQEKLANSNLSSKQEDELAAIYLTQKQLGSFKDVISNIQNTSGEPGFAQNALAIVASNPSDGIWSSLARQGAELFLTDDSRLKEDVRGTVSSAIQSAISGKVITRLEATQLGFIPKGDDTIARLIQKAESLEKYLKNKENGILMASGGVPSPINPTATQPSAPVRVTSKAQYDALEPGTSYIDSKGKQGTKR